jgi:hypothetical protein
VVAAEYDQQRPAIRVVTEVDDVPGKVRKSHIGKLSAKWNGEHIRKNSHFQRLREIMRSSLHLLTTRRCDGDPQRQIHVCDWTTSPSIPVGCRV